jgi:hypothetical protein
VKTAPPGFTSKTCQQLHHDFVEMKESGQLVREIMVNKASQTELVNAYILYRPV